MILGRFLAALVAAAAATPSPKPSPSGPPQWLPVESRPSASPTPYEFPHWVRLSPEDQAELDALTAAIAASESQLAAGHLLSAGETLADARAHADAIAKERLELALFPAWKDAQTRARVLGVRLSIEHAKGPDPESCGRAEETRDDLDARLKAAERVIASGRAAEAAKGLAPLRAAFAAAEAEMKRQDNQAWVPFAKVLDARLARVVARTELLVGQAALLDQIIGMAELYASSQRQLKKGAYDAAEGDLTALEEACVSFQQDLADLVAKGFDPASIRYEGEEGGRSGKTFLQKVDFWLLEAKRRNETLAAARDPWRHVLTGDRLKLYAMRGVPTWDGAPPDPTPEEAAAAPQWVYWEKAGAGPHGEPLRVRHVFRFDGDALLGHDTGPQPLVPPTPPIGPTRGRL